MIVLRTNIPLQLYKYESLEYIRTVRLAHSTTFTEKKRPFQCKTRLMFHWCCLREFGYWSWYYILISTPQLEYQVDLDSVYKMDGSERPVYKLAKVHTQERNLFELLVQIVFTDNNVSDQFKSKPFLIKTKRLSEEQIGTSFWIIAD